MREVEVWLVPGSQAMYGDRILAAVKDHAEEIGRALDSSAAIPVRVVTKPVMVSAESIQDICIEASRDPNCIGVIAWMHTFSPAKLWIAGLQALRKPLLHLHTQYNRDLPWGEIDMDFMNLNQSAHGDREFGFMETRLRINRKTVVGHWQDPEVAERIGTWVRAATGLHEARHLKVARFGDNMRQVAVTEGDKVEAQIVLGLEVNTWPVNELAAAAAAADAAAVDREVEAVLDEYRVVAELLPGAPRHESLREALRIQVGLESILVEGGFGAFTDSFEDLGSLPQLPGLAVQRLMAKGYGFGGEGDWKTSVLVRLLKVMGEGLPGGTSFMEDYTYHLAAEDPRALGAHMLEVCPSITQDKPSCEIHPLWIGGKADPVRLVFNATPAAAIGIGMLDLGTRFRFVLDELDVVPPLEDLPKLPVARAVWKPRPSMKVAAECWLSAGGPHHMALSTALRREHLEDFADMAGIELAAIGAETTARDFRNELRWNQVYHHLAKGL
jgi:L-arabinose isomerase